MKSLLRWMAPICGLLVLNGCTLAPFYDRPVLPVAAAWPGETPVVPPPATADIGWHDFFQDARLRRLIDYALVNNRDLRIASLNVAAARAQYRVQRSDLFPTINATANEVAQRQPNFYNIPGQPLTTHTYAAGLGFTAYEFDLFGRIRSLNKRALELYFGYAETRTSAQITLVSEVAVAYLTWLADQDLLRLTQDTLTSQKASYDLTKRRFEAGVTTALDLRQSETAVDTARVNLAQYTRLVMQDLNALVLLLGGPLPVDLPPAVAFNDQGVLTDLPEGLPSDILTRRPDVRAAEHQLIAANANIGAARAAFFPSISLTGNFGTASTQLNGLFQNGSQAWVFNPQVSMPIFAAGANFANLDLANIQKRIEIAHYEKTIQSAFREVSDSLAGRRTLDEQLAAQQALVDASSETYRLSDMRFKAGVDNYLSVIVSQRAMYGAQQELISVKLLRLENLVTLYKALGGGWTAQSIGPVPFAAATAFQTPAISTGLPSNVLVSPSSDTVISTSTTPSPVPSQ